MSPGSSPTFSLAFALFETDAAALRCEQAIGQLKKDLGVNEFHFVDLDDGTRRAFLEAVREHDFCYVVQTLHKRKLKHRAWQKKAFFYERTAEKMAQGIEEYLHIAQECCLPEPLNAKVVLDRNGDPEYMRAMGNHLRSIKDRAGRSLVGSIRAHRSVSSELVQLADMVCGAVVHPPFGKIIARRKLAEVSWP